MSHAPVSRRRAVGCGKVVGILPLPLCCTPLPTCPLGAVGDVARTAIGGRRVPSIDCRSGRCGSPIGQHLPVAPGARNPECQLGVQVQGPLCVDLDMVEALWKSIVLWNDQELSGQGLSPITHSQGKKWVEEAVLLDDRHTGNSVVGALAPPPPPKPQPPAPPLCRSSFWRTPFITAYKTSLAGRGPAARPPGQAHTWMVMRVSTLVRRKGVSSCLVSSVNSFLMAVMRREHSLRWSAFGALIACCTSIVQISCRHKSASCAGKACSSATPACIAKTSRAQSAKMPFIVRHISTCVTWYQWTNHVCYAAVSWV